jgi:hypothetical protein
MRRACRHRKVIKVIERNHVRSDTGLIVNGIEPP